MPKIIISSLLLIMCNIAVADFPNTLKQHYAPNIILPSHINISVPDIAELKSQVQFKIDSLQLPTSQSFVTEINVYINNSSVPIATYQLSEASIADGLISRIKLPYGKNTLYFIARLNDGSIIGGEASTKANRACNGGI